MRRRHTEHHRTDRIGWLRAAVLGANDGIVSTASLMVGVASSQSSAQAVLLTGVAGLVAGAMSMAAGEYVSVHSQADVEAADLAKERAELAADPAAELRELAGIWRQRGLAPELALQVATELTSHDALAAHARDELGLTTTSQARPLQAALASAGSFAAGALVPLLAGVLAPASQVSLTVSGASFALLLLLGGVAARAGGASVWRGAARVGGWGALAMVVTGLAGAWFGAVG